MNTAWRQFAEEAADTVGGGHDALMCVPPPAQELPLNARAPPPFMSLEQCRLDTVRLLHIAVCALFGHERRSCDFSSNLSTVVAFLEHKMWTFAAAKTWVDPKELVTHIVLQYKHGKLCDADVPSYAMILDAQLSL